MDETILEFDDNRHLIELCGAHDRHLAAIEEGFKVTIVRRGNVLGVHGDGQSRALAAEALRALYARLEEGSSVGAGDVDAAVRMVTSDHQLELFKGEKLEIRTRKRRVEPRSPGQKTYVRALYEHELVLGVGPAGTGKTYLAVAAGISMYLEGKIERIILSRPAVEAGERLGFLPGDMKEKIDPYLRPLYDALNDLWGGAKIEKLIEEGRVEVAPSPLCAGARCRTRSWCSTRPRTRPRCRCACS